MIGFSNATLEKLPKVKVGDKVRCNKCGEEHELVGPDSGGLLLFYRCGTSTYLGAVDGRNVIGVPNENTPERQHELCDRCWPQWLAERGGDPNRVAVRVKNSGVRPCCRCGRENKSGIFVNENPATMPCKGVHTWT